MLNIPLPRLLHAQGAATKNACFSWISQKASEFSPLSQTLMIMPPPPGQLPLFCIVRNVEELAEHLHKISSSNIPSSSLCSLFTTEEALSATLPDKCSYHEIPSTPATSTGQANHRCALANVRHISTVMMDVFNKLEVPFKQQ